MHLLPARTRLVALTAAALLVGGLAACGGDDSTADAGDGTTTTAAPAGGDDYGAADSGGDDGSGSTEDGSVVAQGIAFANDLTVAPEGSFTFDNQDSTAHTLTADDGSFDSGNVPGANQSDPIAAPAEPGDYAFHCEIHPSMTGTLTVE